MIMAILFIFLYVINTTVFMPSTVSTPFNQVVLPVYGLWMLLCGLAAGVAGLLAVLRQGERSWLVWLAMLPGLMALFLVLGEFLAPH